MMGKTIKKLPLSEDVFLALQLYNADVEASTALSDRVAALANELGLAIRFVEMAAYADNSREEYGRLCQECESIFSQHTDNCALSAWLERNKGEA